MEDCNSLEHKEFLTNSQSDKIRIFKVKPNVGADTEELKKVENACNKFYFFTNQDDIGSVKRNVKVMLDDILQGQYIVFDNQDKN